MMNYFTFDDKNIHLPSEVRKYEEEPLIKTKEWGFYSCDEEIPLKRVDDFLYHGIRFQSHLEKLESIFRDKKILAGNYIEGYYSYDDNCNKGEFVSLLRWLGTDSIEYDTFICSNVSLVVSPMCDAIETYYVSYDVWEDLQKVDVQLKNYYSYMRGECFCKEYVPLDMVKAVGVPYTKMVNYGEKDEADILVDDIRILMEKYDVSLPIVDTSFCNYVLVDVEGVKSKKLKRFDI